MSLELDLPAIYVEVPSPSEIAKRTAAIVCARLQSTLAAGQDALGRALGASAKATLARRAADRHAPLKPRSTRYATRYPGTTAGAGSLRGVDSGYLANRIRVAAGGGSTAEIQAPEGRPIRDIEGRLRAEIFCATPAHLEEAVAQVLGGVFRSWDNASTSATAAVRRGISS